MKLSALKLTKHTLLLIAGTLAFIAAFVWLLATRGPLAPVGVETATVTRADLSPAVYGIGTVEAQHDYSVGPIQAGRLLRVLVDQGDAVKAGQLLAEIDPVDLRQRAEAARSATARARQAALAAQAQVAEADSRARLAQANMRALPVAIPAEFCRQRNGRQPPPRSRRPQRQPWQRRVPTPPGRSARSAVPRPNCRASTQLRQSLKLVSPIDGVVTAREAEPGATVVAGQAVLRLVDPARLWVRARVDQARARACRSGQAADIVLRSVPGAGAARKGGRGSTCKAMR